MRFIHLTIDPEKSSHDENCDCVCDDGFVFNGQECEIACDEEQCLEDNICPEKSVCVEKCDMYECECISGYIMDANGECTNDGSGGYGDPHFHIIGRSYKQPDLCFDINPPKGTDSIVLGDTDGLKGKFFCIIIPPCSQFN